MGSAAGAAAGGPPLAWASGFTSGVGEGVVDGALEGFCCFWGFGSEGGGPGCWGAFCLEGSVVVLPLAVGGCRMSSGAGFPLVTACAAGPDRPAVNVTAQELHVLWTLHVSLLATVCQTLCLAHPWRVFCMQCSNQGSCVADYSRSQQSLWSRVMMSPATVEETIGKVWVRCKR